MNKIKQFFLDELAALKKGITVPEYIFWWVLRILQTYALIRLIKSDPDDINVLLLALNLLATFTVPLVRILLLPKSLVRKIPFRAQTWLDVMIFFGSFLAQGLRWNHEVTSWDKILHVMAGAVILLVGNELIEVFLRKDEKVSPLFRTFAASGFSCTAMVIWEVFEFMVDYYWPESCNQAYNISPERDPWFQAIFGLGAQNENQWAVFDTNVDMMCALAGAIPVAIILLIVLSVKEKKALAAKEAEKEEKETVKA